MKWNKVVTNIHGIYRDNRQTLRKSENLLKSMQEVARPGAELTRQKKSSPTRKPMKMLSSAWKTAPSLAPIRMTIFPYLSTGGLRNEQVFPFYEHRPRAQTCQRR